MLSEDLGGDCKWQLTRDMPLLMDRLVASEELAKYMFELRGAAYNSGRKDCYAEGKAFTQEGTEDEKFELFKEECAANCALKHHEFGFLEFGIVKAIEKLARRGVVVETLKKVLEGGDAGSGGAGPSQ
ncbi:hypothetical protein HanPI659440_Chr02g0044951 [Helianthus annuus]|nr:hypothetical protein HanPI659440_Chr02g0044951 [Helianthus annuus]